MVYDDKYENHFLNIECGRARFGDFGTHTLNSIRKPGTPPALAALAPNLAAKLAAFMGKVTTRIGEGGVAQENTATEDEQWDVLKAFITETDVTVLQPAYFKNAKGLTKFYPAKLSGLTQSNKPDRVPNFEAYTKALEADAAKITAVPGQQARALLAEYKRVADVKDAGESSVSGLIRQLGPEAQALCQALWEVHCAGLAAYASNPALAKALFNYGLLPKKNRPSKKKPA